MSRDRSRATRHGVKRRIAALVMWALTCGTGAFAASCGTSSAGDDFVSSDGGTDATVDQAVDQATPSDRSSPPDQRAADVSTDTTVPDAAMPDHDANTQTDSSPATATDAKPDTAASDAGLDGASADAPSVPVDAGPLAKCSAVDGPACDIVSQNCPLHQECVLATASDGGLTTACSADLASEHLPAGHTCCLSQTNPCDPGLECIGDPCSADAAAAPSGRCTPHCCIGPDGGDDSVCGTSPEGYRGQCDLDLTDNDGHEIYAVCTYEPSCIPLGVKPCPAGLACLVSDSSGASACSAVVAPDGGVGLGEGEPCAFGNECADGLMCLTGADGGFACTWLCDIPGQATPFDAGVLTNVAGHGACPTGESCFEAPSIFPPWLGACSR